MKDLDLLEKALRGEFGEVWNPRDGRLAVTADGYRVTLAGGQATSQHPRLGAVVGRVKQAYARTAVQAQAKRFGWTVIKGADANHFQIRKG